MKNLISAALLATSLLTTARPLAAQTLRAGSDYLALNPVAPEQATAAEAGRYCFVVPEDDFTSEATSDPTTEQVLTTLVQQVTAATQQHDTAALARFLGPEYRHYTPDNQVASRQAELAFIGSSHNPFASATVVGPVTVSSYGTTAVTVSNILFGIKNNTGQPIAHTIQMLMVWVQRAGRWQIAVVDSKELTAARAK